MLSDGCSDAIARGPVDVHIACGRSHCRGSRRRTGVEHPSHDRVRPRRGRPTVDHHQAGSQAARSHTAGPGRRLLEIIEIANHAPMGGNLERNRWMIVTDGDLKAAIAERFAAVGRPYLAANSEIRADDRSQKVIDSAEFLVDHLAEVPALVIALRLDRPPLDPSTQGGAAAYYGSVLPGVWSFQLAARSRGIGRHGRRSTSSTSPTSPSSSASRRPSPRSVSSPSATTPARRSRPPRDARRGRSPTSTAGSIRSSSGPASRLTRLGRRAGSAVRVDRSPG